MTIENAYYVENENSTTHDLTVSISSNSDRILGIQIMVRGYSSDVISSVVLDPGGNDEAATNLQVSGGSNCWASTYYIINPTSGASQTLRVTTSQSSNIDVMISALDMSGMDTTAIEAGYDIDNGTGSAIDCVFTTTEDGCHVQSVACSEANSGPGVDTWSGVTGQTTQDATDRGLWLSLAAYATQTSSGSLTMGYSSQQADTWYVGGVAWAVIGTTPVNDDLEAKWDIRNLVNDDLEAEWDIRNLVYDDIQALWDILNLVNDDLELEWDILNSVNEDIEAEWDIRELVNEDIEAVWDIESSAILVNEDIQALWDIRNLVNDDLEAQWDITNLISDDLEAEWDILNSVNDDIEAVYDIFNLASDDLEAQWDILNAVNDDIEAVWDMSGSVNKDLEMVYDLGEAAGGGGRVYYEIRDRRRRKWDEYRRRRRKTRWL